MSQSASWRNDDKILAHDQEPPKGNSCVYSILHLINAMRILTTPISGTHIQEDQPQCISHLLSLW